MANQPISATVVGKWSVGFSRSTGQTILMFEFTDRPPINLAVSRADAAAIAKSIQEQLGANPPQPGKMN